MDKRTKKRMIAGYLEAGGYRGWATQSTAMKTANALYDLGCRAYTAGRIAAEKMADSLAWITIVEAAHSCNKRYLIARGPGAEDIEDVINILRNGGNKKHLLEHLTNNPRKEQVK